MSLEEAGFDLELVVSFEEEALDFMLFPVVSFEEADEVVLMVSDLPSPFDEDKGAPEAVLTLVWRLRPLFKGLVLGIRCISCSPSTLT